MVGDGGEIESAGDQVSHAVVVAERDELPFEFFLLKGGLKVVGVAWPACPDCGRLFGKQEGHAVRPYHAAAHGPQGRVGPPELAVAHGVDDRARQAGDLVQVLGAGDRDDLAADRFDLAAGRGVDGPRRYDGDVDAVLPPHGERVAHFGVCAAHCAGCAEIEDVHVNLAPL